MAGKNRELTETSRVSGAGSSASLPDACLTRLAPRFGGLLPQVRLHVEEPTALALRAHAFTVGRDIVFAPGRFRPDRTDGQRLLAHELAHVEQQQHTGLVLQREESTEDELRRLNLMFDQAREDLENLRQQFMLVGLRGPKVGSRVGDDTPELVEALIETSPFLEPYLRGRLATTSVRKNFHHYASDSAFLDKADELDHVVRPISYAKNRDAPRPMGFYHRRTDSIHLPPEANLGHAMHEALHRYSSPVTQAVFGVFINEGFTQYFTDRVLAEQQVEGKTTHRYQRQLDCARKVIGWSSPEMVAKSYFLGEASPLSVVLAQHTGATGGELQRLAHTDDGLGLCERIEGARP